MKTIADRIDQHADYLDRWRNENRAAAIRRALAYQPLSVEDRSEIEQAVTNLRHLGRRSLADGIDALLQQEPA